MLYTHTPAQNISSEKDNAGLWTINTPRGTVKAKKVAFACNAYTSAILPMYSNKIIPVRGVCCRIVPTHQVKKLTETYTLRWNDNEADYLIPREDGSIVVGGGWRKYSHDTGKWYNNANDAEMIGSAKEYFDDYMQRNFHGWEKSGAYTDKIWTGSKSNLNTIYPGRTSGEHEADVVTF
jgi:glycine/D-amino acid oxidase-like deaminating enzyme